MGQALETLAQVAQQSRSVVVPTLIFRVPESVSNGTREEPFLDDADLEELPQQPEDEDEDNLD